MSDTQIVIKLTSGEEFRVPLHNYNILADGRVQVNNENGQYTIFPIGVAYILKEKYVAEEETKKSNKD